VAGGGGVKTTENQIFWTRCIRRLPLGRRKEGEREQRGRGDDLGKGGSCTEKGAGTVGGV
jgi:hypothetical protein